MKILFLSQISLYKDVGETLSNLHSNIVLVISTLWQFPDLKSPFLNPSYG